MRYAICGVQTYNAHFIRQQPVHRKWHAVPTVFFFFFLFLIFAIKIKKTIPNTIRFQGK